MARWLLLSALLVLCTPAAADTPEEEPAPIARLDEADALAGLATRVEALAEVDQFSGAFLVARHDKILLQRAWGHSDFGVYASVRSAGTLAVGDQVVV